MTVLAIGVLFSSLSSILIRLADAPAFAVAAYRLIFSTAFILPLVAASAIRARGSQKPRPANAGPEPPSARRDIGLAIASGVFLSVHFATWISSLDLTSVAAATVLVTTHPIIVAGASALFLGDRLRKASLGFMVLALGGSVLLAFAGGDGRSSQLLGNLLAFAGAVAVSGYIIIGRLLRPRMGLNRYTLIVYGTAAVLLLGLAAVTRTPLSGYPLREYVIFALLALVCTNLGHSLINWALKYIRPTVVSVSILAEPVIATVLALILFAEVPGAVTLVGAIIVLTSIGLFVRSETSDYRKK